MGKKYRILICGNEAGRVEHNDIVELEELDEKKETLEKVLEQKYWEVPSGGEPVHGDFVRLAQSARSYFQSHPEELGLVRIEDVLETLDKANYQYGFEPDHIWGKGYKIPKICYLKKAIEGMKGEGK